MAETEKGAPIQAGGSGLSPETVAALWAVVNGAASKDTQAAPGSESGWKSRKLWVALMTLTGMLVQIPMEKRLSAQELLAFAIVAVAYIVIQGLVDIAKVRAKGEPGA